MQPSIKLLFQKIEPKPFKWINAMLSNVGTYVQKILFHMDYGDDISVQLLRILDRFSN